MASEGDRDALIRTPEERAEDEAFLATYGDWDPLTPAETARELEGFEHPWWVVGGWAIEAATGYRREHEDTDISIRSTDVPSLVEHLRGRWHVWNNEGGVLRPLGDRWPDAADPASQLWVRRDARSPWVLDIPLTPSTRGEWTNKFLEDHVAEIDEVTWLGDDDIRYLLPEIVLVYKARLHRAKDQPDFEAALPLLTAERRSWMRTALETLVPTHHWLGSL